MRFLFPTPDQIIVFEEYCPVCETKTDHHAFFNLYHHGVHKVIFTYHCSCCYQHFPNETHEFKVKYDIPKWLEFMDYDDVIRDN